MIDNRLEIATMIAIEIKNLTKKFKDIVAVNNVDLKIYEGECFGLLGPNGAGKTSLIRMVTAVSPPTSGEIYILGHDLKLHSREIKALLGVIPQIDNLDPDLTVIQNLLTFARYFDIPRREALKRSIEALSLLQLEDRSNSPIRELSGGMRRRLLIARGLINSPRILVLDEPTVGLDPQAKHLVWDKLIQLKAQGITQLLCTQNMEEADFLCDRVAIMHAGKIVDIDAPKELISKHLGKNVWEIELDTDRENKIVKMLQDKGLDFQIAGNRIYLFGDEGTDLLPQLTAPHRVRNRPPTLEDVFLKLTGRSLTE
jgi:lipooligosaccharide transport system ATP-binding protein